MRILLLGGTTEASQMAQALATAGIDAVFSYAGRTNAPVKQPLKTRIGGFGGTSGLRSFLTAEGISHVIDATHPFAAGMSTNAFAACNDLRMPLIRLERPPWAEQDGDSWTEVADVQSIPDALPETPQRVFLAIGKQQIDLFAQKTQHHYLLRFVDTPTEPLPMVNADVVIARGPFDVAGDLALMRQHRITYVVAKNAGGAGARAKLDAARALRLPVILAARPKVPGDATLNSVTQALHWLHHTPSVHSADRGVNT